MKNGFSIAVFIVSVAVVLIGSVSYIVYKQQKQPVIQGIAPRTIVISDNLQNKDGMASQDTNSISSVKTDDSEKRDFGSCKPLIYRGKVDEKINVVFLSPKDVQNDIFKISLLSLFDEKETYSFYSISPYNRHKYDFNFFYLNEYADSLTTAKRILKDKCAGLSENIYQIISLGSPIGGIINDYFKTTNKIGYQEIGAYEDYINKKPRLVSLHTFLHEIGHSFGGLGEGYEVSFPYDESTATAINNYKTNHLNNSDLPPNWDIEGSPKWCSGKINAQSVCYEDYSILKRCLLSSETNNDKAAGDCIISFYSALERKGVGTRPPKCDLGLSCVSNTNSWFIGNGYFRAYASDIMNSGSDSVSFANEFNPSYGPAGEKQIENTISRLKIWANAKKKLKDVNVKMVESQITNFEDRDRLYAKFSVMDNSGNISLFADEILDKTFSVEYKRPGETSYYEIGIVKRDSEGNYYVDITNYRSEKDLPMRQADLVFRIPIS